MRLLLLLLALMLAGCQRETILAFKSRRCPQCIRDEQRLDARFIRIDVDRQPEAADRYQVDRLPTYIVIDADGREQRRTHRLADVL